MGGINELIINKLKVSFINILNILSGLRRKFTKSMKN